MNPSPSPKYAEKHAERFLDDMLSAWCLDVEYTHARGNTVHSPDVSGSGSDTAVTDFVGGFGSLIFGHNHPEIIDHAKALLDELTPVHAQFSQRTQAHEVAARLNAILRREFADQDEGSAGSYSAIFANSGAEAIEAALKHAELERVTRLGALSEELTGNLARATEALRAGTAVLGPRASDLIDSSADQDADVTVLAEELGRHNAAALACPSLFLALTGGFHGKLTGSLQLTHNQGFRLPFQGLGAQTRFVPAGQPEKLLETLEAERVTALDVTLSDGVVEVVDRDVPVFAAMFAEPVLGEGGIVELRRAEAQRIQEICRAAGIPLVVDEIQTGVGRTGAFFASSRIGLRGDYYTLAKSLGGGLAKTSVLLVRSDRYQQEFELLHSSTFAKDSFSCSIALKVLDMLEADGGHAYRLAAERGAALRTALEGVQADYPDVVADVRGTGLLLGFEFRDQSDAVSAHIRAQALGGFFGFAVAGYLLREHGVRLMPTGSAPNTLRVEPSVQVTDAEITKLTAGLRTVCEILRNQDALHLVRPLAGRTAESARREVKDFRTEIAVPHLDEPSPLTVGYVADLGTPAALRAFDSSLADLDDDALRAFVRRTAVAGALAPLPPVRFRSRHGSSVDLVVYPVLTPESGGSQDEHPEPPAAALGQLRTAVAAGHAAVALAPAFATAALPFSPGVPVVTGDGLGGANTVVRTPDGASTPPGFAVEGGVGGAVAEALLLALNGPDRQPTGGMRQSAAEHGFQIAG
ncbi:aspartate aminotransferase family protein [Streptomyces sp. NPDC059850]|uniref:aspartate aminotransferase family protein n=1 Tax=Streptomyces sp. NPDC059850 TaxID=3346970 RepID=UPI0036497D0C